MFVPDKDKFEIIECYKTVLEVNELANIDVRTLSETLQPDSLLERFAAKKANKVGGDKDFVKLNLKGQFENNKHV